MSRRAYGMMKLIVKDLPEFQIAKNLKVYYTAKDGSLRKASSEINKKNNSIVITYDGKEIEVLGYNNIQKKLIYKYDGIIHNQNKIIREEEETNENSK